MLFELIRKSINDKIAIPEKYHFHPPIPDALLKDGNWQLRRDIFEGLNKVTSSLKDCQQWFDVRRMLMGNSFYQIYSGCYDEISKLDLQPIQDEALHSMLLLVSIWCNIATLYSNIADKPETDKTQYQLLNDEIFDSIPYVVSFMELALQNSYWEKLSPVKSKFKDCITRLSEHVELDYVKNLLNQIIHQLSEGLNRNKNDQAIQIYFADIIEVFKITNSQNIEKDTRFSPEVLGHDLFNAIKAINNKLHLLASTQEILRRDHKTIFEAIKKSREDILSFYDCTTRKVISTVISIFDERELLIIKTILEKMRLIQKTNENNFTTCLKAIKIAINEVKKKKLFIGNYPALTVLKSFEDVLESPKLSIKHKLEYCIPIIPLFLKYKGIVEFNSVANIEKIWNWLRNSFGHV